jgi:homoserine kinase
VAVALLHEPDLLPAAMRDRVHEDVRLELVPEMREVFDRVRGAGLAVCVSGSGPTLLAFERHDVVTPEPGEGWRTLRVPVRAAGVDIRED